MVAGVSVVETVFFTYQSSSSPKPSRMSWYPQWGPVTDDIGNLAKIQLFYVGFSQKNGTGVVHIDGKRSFYHAHPTVLVSSRHEITKSECSRPDLACASAMDVHPTEDRKSQ